HCDLTFTGDPRMAKLFVCQSTSCRSSGGSDKLLRDLEELCATPYSGCQAVSTGCLDLCGKGPNVKVQVKSDQKVVEGVKTFKAARTLLEKHGAKLRKLDLTVAEIKYDARRAKTSEERLAKVEKGFKAIGNDWRQEPHLASSLLALRAEELLAKEDLEAALTDARKACELWAGSGPAHLSVAVALLKLGKTDEAKKAFDLAQDTGTSLNKEHMRFVMNQLRDAPKPDPAPKAEAAPPKAEAVPQSEAAPPKAKAALKGEAVPPNAAPKAVPKAEAAAKVAAPPKAKASNGSPATKAQPSDAKAAPPEVEESTAKAEVTTSFESRGSRHKTMKVKSASMPSSKGTEKMPASKSKSLDRLPSKIDDEKSKAKKGNSKKDSPDAAEHAEDAQTTAAEVMSGGSRTPVVDGELSESGLVEPGPPIASCGTGLAPPKYERKIVSL
ncbi:Hypothetical protein (Fragment), partial [Durusdinium trenchii]